MKSPFLYKDFRIVQEGRITGYDFVIQQGDDGDTMVSGYYRGGSTEKWKGKDDETGQLFMVSVAEDKRGQGTGYTLMLLSIRYIYAKGRDYFVTSPNEQSFWLLEKLKKEGLIKVEYEPNKLRETHVYRIMPGIENKLPGAKFEKRNPESKEGPRNPPTLLGREISISMPNGERRRGLFAIVELADVLASHNEFTFSSSEGYPTNAKGQNINDRNYQDDLLAQERVRENAVNLDPYRIITTSRTPSGTPIVADHLFGGKWIVVSGNNRTMSTKIAAQKHPENYRKYRQVLCEEFSSFGFRENEVGSEPRGACNDENQITLLPTGDGWIYNQDQYQFKEPFLVRIDYDFPAFQTQELAKYNQSTMKGKRAIDKTIERSNALRENEACATKIPLLLDSFERLSDFYTDRNAQKQMLDMLLQCNLVTEQSIPEYYEQGYFTSAGKELVESVLAGIVLEKDALKASERDGVKKARQAVVYALPALIANSRLEGKANLIPRINDAILYQNGLQASGLPFDQYINQGALFTEKQYCHWAIYLNRLMNAGQRKFKSAILSFNASMKDSGTAGLFPGQAVTPEEAFDAYVKKSIPESEARLIEQYHKGKALQENPEQAALDERLEKVAQLYESIKNPIKAQDARNRKGKTPSRYFDIGGYERVAESEKRRFEVSQSKSFEPYEYKQYSREEFFKSSMAGRKRAIPISILKGELEKDFEAARKAYNELVSVIGKYGYSMSDLRAATAYPMGNVMPAAGSLTGATHRLVAQSYALEKGHKNASEEKAQAARRQLYDAIEEAKMITLDSVLASNEHTRPRSVYLQSLPNIDFVTQSPEEIAREELAKTAFIELPVKSVKEAREAVRAFIKTLNLGGGNFLPANVMPWSGWNDVAQIAYNGKIITDKARFKDEVPWPNALKRVEEALGQKLHVMDLADYEVLQAHLKNIQERLKNPPQNPVKSAVKVKLRLAKLKKKKAIELLKLK